MRYRPLHDIVHDEHSHPKKRANKHPGQRLADTITYFNVKTFYTFGGGIKGVVNMSHQHQELGLVEFALT